MLLDMPLEEAVDSKRFQAIIPQNIVRVEKGFSEVNMPSVEIKTIVKFTNSWKNPCFDKSFLIK